MLKFWKMNINLLGYHLTNQTVITDSLETFTFLCICGETYTLMFSIFQLISKMSGYFNLFTLTLMKHTTLHIL